ncbi:hypothetical protein PLESTM_000323800 [Pleodorina starrii]|nr:hypothetical protein PLESTM_000323800 [Pleodorina starrii]
MHAGGREGVAAEWADTVAALAACLPALSHLHIMDVPNPADDHGVAKLLRLCATAATAAGAGAGATTWTPMPAARIPPPPPLAPEAAAPPPAAPGEATATATSAAVSDAFAVGALRQLDLDFLDADDDCDYVRSAQITFAAGRDSSGGSQQDDDSDAGGVALGVRVMAVVVDSDRYSESTGSGSSSGSSGIDSGASSWGGSEGGSRPGSEGGSRPGSDGGEEGRSESVSGSSGTSSSAESNRDEGGSAQGCRSGTTTTNSSSSSSRSRGRDSDSGDAGGRVGAGVGRAHSPAANDVMDDVTTAIGDLLRNLGLPYWHPPTDPTAYRPDDPASALSTLALASDCGGPSPEPDRHLSPSASGLSLPDGRFTNESARMGPRESPAHTAPDTAAAEAPTDFPRDGPLTLLGEPPSPPPPPRATAAAVAVVTSLEVTLCCDAAAGSRGAQALNLDLSSLPGLRSLGLRLFSDTATTSFSQGCELRLRGAAALTSLRLLRSGGAAPPPELGGGLAAALAREAPCLRQLVVEGAVLGAARAASAVAVAEEEAGRAGSGCCEGERVGGDGGRRWRLEHLALRLLPYCGPPRYSRSLDAAWLPSSLTYLELANADLLASPPPLPPPPPLAPEPSASSAAEASDAAAAAEPRLPLADAGACASRRVPPSRPANASSSSSNSISSGGGGGGAERPDAELRRPLARLPYLAHLQLHGCHVADLPSLSSSTDLTHLALSDCSAPGATAATALAAAWPSLRTLTVSATLPAQAGGASQALPPAASQLVQQQRQGAAANGSGVAAAKREAQAEVVLEPWALRPEDVGALAAVSGLRCLSWQVPRSRAGVGLPTLERLPCLSSLRRLSLHLGFDNDVTPAQLLSCLGRLRRLVELEVVVGHGPCRAFVGGEGGSQGRAVAACGGVGGEDERAAGTRRVFRRPMRYGSKLAMRDPERFRRMKAILGYPDDASAGKVDRVTISTLQTMKYLMSGSENLGMLQGMAAYKVTSLNREVLPLLERTEALIRGKQ